MRSTNHRARLIVWLLTAAMLLVLLSAPTLASDSEFDATGATYFTFTDSAVTAVDGEYKDYKIDGTTLNIRGAGTYVVSGACSDGSISIRKGVTGVGSVMNGLTLSNTGSETTATAPVVCGKSTGVDNVVASGTTNTLTDSIYDNDDNYPDLVEVAALWHIHHDQQLIQRILHSLGIDQPGLLPVRQLSRIDALFFCAISTALLSMSSSFFSLYRLDLLVPSCSATELAAPSLAHNPTTALFFCSSEKCPRTAPHVDLSSSESQLVNPLHWRLL